VINQVWELLVGRVSKQVGQRLVIDQHRQAGQELPVRVEHCSRIHLIQFSADRVIRITSQWEPSLDGLVMSFCLRMMFEIAVAVAKAKGGIKDTLGVS
jgi:hypothetical protein